MSCADDLTADDLSTSVATAVLERVSAGEGSNTNLWAQIDRDKSVFLSTAPIPREKLTGIKITVL
jgi:hypothetical protein